MSTKTENQELETGKAETGKAETEKAMKSKVEQKFTKSQIITSRKYAKHRDVLSTTLSDAETYSHEEVAKAIETFLGGKR